MAMLTVAGRPYVVELGWLNEPDTRGGGIQGRLLYLADDGVIVVPYRPQGRYWQCLVLAARSRRRRGALASFTAATLARAVTDLVVDPVASPHTFFLLWQARLGQRWPSTATQSLGYRLIEHSRPDGAGGWLVTLGPTTVRHLAQEIRLPAHALHRLFDRLSDAGLLRRATATRTQWTLALPDGDAPKWLASRKSAVPIHPTE